MTNTSRDVNVGDLVQYHGSQTEYHGEYRISNVPLIGTRGYVLFTNEKVLHYVDRSSFTVFEK